MANPRIKSLSKDGMYSLASVLFTQSYNPLQEIDKSHDLTCIRREILSRLTPNEKCVIECRYPLNGTEKTYFEISQKLGIDIEEVRELEKKALKHIKSVHGSSLLEQYFIN